MTETPAGGPSERPPRPTLSDSPGAGPRRRYSPDTKRTSRSRAGESVADARNWPGMTLIAVGLVALAATLTAAGYGFTGWTVVGAVVAAVCLIGGATLVVVEHRRIRAHEGDRLRDPGGH
ncbi:hypothetical protein [Nocardia sp. BMG51109]|uniref:hypothetical protein n=1 Tax=Nocardia sp. BMG51109 TaxID=1056816 RepID=UPI0012EBEBB8|nr:hypothetical protein [Nocardia sp. BMG51109]